MRFLACIQYDGSSFFGFQRLNKERTVQKEIEKVLSKINKSSVIIKGAGRTDKGVHAKKQMCHFDLNININEKGLKLAMNSMLPSDIYVNYIKVVDDNFHARFLVNKKEYTYVINMGEYDAINDRYLYNYCKKLNISLMKKGAKLLIGKKSYKFFVSGERENYNSIIYNINFKTIKNKLYITFIGTSFYRYMVRNLVGSLIALSEGKYSIVDFKNVIDSGEKKVTYMTVPSNGLYLDNIEYK